MSKTVEVVYSTIILIQHNLIPLKQVYIQESWEQRIETNSPSRAHRRRRTAPFWYANYAIKGIIFGSAYIVSNLLWPGLMMAGLSSTMAHLDQEASWSPA